MINTNLVNTSNFGGIILPKMNASHTKQYSEGKKAALIGDMLLANVIATGLAKDAEAHMKKGNYTSAIVLYSAANQVIPFDLYLGGAGEAWYQLALVKEQGYEGQAAYEAATKASAAFISAMKAATIKSKSDIWAKKSSDIEAWMNNIDKTAKPDIKSNIKLAPEPEIEPETDATSNISNIVYVLLAAGVVGIVTYFILRDKD